MTDPLFIFVAVILLLLALGQVLWPPNWIKVVLWCVVKLGGSREKFIATLWAEVQKEPNPKLKEFYAWTVALGVS